MKKSITMSAPAKVNLYLDVKRKRADSYHDIESIMQSISLCDYVTVTIDTEEKSDRVTITCTDPNVPTGEDNICTGAVRSFFEYCGDGSCGVDIHIEKHIPMEAGLSGGSADAAAVVAALNNLTGVWLDSEELCNIGSDSGADVPFCIVGRTQYCTGRGDMLRQLSYLPDCFFVVAKGKESVSTAAAYKKIDEDDIQPIDTEDIAAAFCSGNIEEIAPYCQNIFEQAVDLPEVKDIKEIMLEAGALCSVMTGSGSAVYGIFRETSDANRCADRLIGSGYFAVTALPVRAGVAVKND
ncbi:MAG: 4-(cytidine 5'-diphospho)-2-C-methyl-D-erythritol kinase [Oscillospiraceae bacterium]|nr:4-(cytidine 5'-diphospho)-2-C-methyl-D-erythritol kinase [Oscillospiraceae bacterium]